MCETTEGLSLAVYGVRSDATNSGVWQKSKLQCTEVDSLYLVSMSEAQQWAESRVDGDDAFLGSRRVMWADI